MRMRKWEPALAAALMLALGLWAFLPRQSGNAVTVTVDGKSRGSFPLSEDMSAAIAGYGGFSLILHIEDGQARVLEATCPDLICQHHAPISRRGEQIICLPGRVVIAVEGEELEIDAVTE